MHDLGSRHYIVLLCELYYRIPLVLNQRVCVREVVKFKVLAHLLHDLVKHEGSRVLKLIVDEVRFICFVLSIGQERLAEEVRGEVDRRVGFHDCVLV
jgi:hypothetical protein